jgi:hypothetical protein
VTTLVWRFKRLLMTARYQGPRNPKSDIKPGVVVPATRHSPRRSYGQKHRLVTASMGHVTIPVATSTTSASNSTASPPAEGSTV